MRRQLLQSPETEVFFQTFVTKIFKLCSRACRHGARARPVHGRRDAALDARRGGYRLHHEGVHEDGGKDEGVR